MSGGDNTVVDGKCKLISQEGKEFIVPLKAAKMSVLVSEMTEEDDASETPEIPLPNVKDSILEKVIEFCIKHCDDPMTEIEKPLKSSNINEVVTEWDAAYINVEHSMLFELILASNYMDIKSLMELSCAKVASMIKGRSPEEIREIFNIVNDFTPEEEARIKEENKWCEES